MSNNSDVEELKSLLEYYDDLYYNQDDPEITDQEYDELKKKYLQATGKTEYNYTPGEAAECFEKFSHPYPVKSLDKVNTEEEVRAAIKNLLPVIIEPKFDGLTVACYPGTVTRSGIFATRGNGIIGEKITHTAIKIEGINRVDKIDYFVRIEAYMPISVFNRINEERIAAGLEPFKNPRNAAAGMLRNKDADKVKGVHYFAYNILGSTLKETDQIHQLNGNGFITTPYWEFNDVEEAVDFIMNFDRHQLDYEIDGLVVKSNKENSLAYYGETEHHPKNAIAYKFPPVGKWTKLNSITWQVGRTGKLTPVAEIEPIDIGGSTISRVTLHNYGIMKTLGVIANPCEVFVIKANDVIPAIIETRRPQGAIYSMPLNEPAECPQCHGEIEKVINQLFCINPDCPAKRINKLAHLAGRDALDIEGLSGETATKLFNTGTISKPFDIFNVTQEQLEKLPGFAKKSADKLYNAIQKSRSTNLNKFIYAAGIPNVGRHMSKDIANKFGSLGAWMQDAENDFKETKIIDGVGDESIKSIYSYGYLLGELAQYVTPKVIEKKAGPVSGKVLTFVITGTLEQPRSYYETLIANAGHKVSGSVSKKTDYVLVGESAGSKLTKAQELGISIITTEQELKGLL